MVACLMFCVVKFIQSDVVDSNILNMIPQQYSDEQSEKVSELLTARAEQQFAILIRADLPHSAEAFEWFSETLDSLPNVAVSVSGLETQERLRAFYRPYRFQLIPSAMRERLQEQSAQQLAEVILRKLYQPVPLSRFYGFSADPFGVGDSWIETLMEGNFELGRAGELIVKDDQHSWFVLRGELLDSPYNLSLQRVMQQTLEDFSMRYAAVELLKSGLVFHAIEGTQISQREVSSIGLGSLITIFCLVFFTFRSWSNALFILAVLAGSWLVGLAVTLAVFGRVHIVTLTFGSTLLGLAADYCFHFLVKTRATGDSRQAIALVSRGLIIGALTSACAYLFQYFTPFPGLKQFSVFVSSGLISACLLVLVFGPLIPARKSSPLWLGIFFERHIQSRYAAVASHRLLVLGLISTGLVVALLSLWHGGTNDDVRLLNVSGEKLIASEKKVKALLGSFDANRYFVTEAENSQQALERSELLAHILSTQADMDEKQLLLSVHQVLPSVRVQGENYNLVQEILYSEKGAVFELCVLLSGSCDGLESFPEFSPILADAPSIDLVDLHPALPLLTQSIAVSFVRDSESVDIYRGLESTLSGTRLVDRVADLSLLLGVFRERALWLLLGFGIFICVLAPAVFSKQFPIVLGVVLISSVMALLTAIATGLTLFHVLALLLVIGVSLDTAIFYAILGLNRDTWAASTLACISSLVVFGFLSFSVVPVLNQFGSVVFVGLLTTWLVAPLIWQVKQRPEACLAKDSYRRVGGL